MKRILKYLFFLIIGIVIAMALIPIFFKDEIIEQIEKYANEQINADLKFEDVSLSFFKSFPKASITIEGVSVTGRDEFQDLTLFSAASVHLATDVKAVIADQSNIAIKAFHLNKPIINIVTTKGGKSNYDITKPSEDTSSGDSSMKLALEEYSITNGDISYKDYAAKIDFEAKDFNQSGKGDFTADIINLSTKNNIKSTSVSMEGIPYLSKTSIEGPLTVEMNLLESKYTLKDNLIKIHDLALSAVGFVDMNGDDIVMDIALDSKEGDFRNFLSLIPNAFYSELPAFETKGMATISTKLKGTFNSAKGSFPALTAKIVARDGYVNSSDLPEAIENINFELNADAKARDWSDLKVAIPQFSITTLGQPFKGNIAISNAMSNPHAKGKMDGTLDLASITKIIDMEGIDVSSGSLTANVDFEGTQSDIENENYGNVKFAGDAKLTNFKAFHSEYKDIQVQNMNTSFDPKKLVLNPISASVGESDFNGDLSIENPLAYFLSDKKMKGKINMKSKTLDLRPFVTESETTEASVAATNTEFDDAVIRQSEIDYDVQIGEVLYPDYKIKDIQSSGKLSSDKIILESTKVVVNDQALQFKGDIGNAYDYVMNDETLDANLNISGNKMDLTAFSGDEASTTSSTEKTSPIIIPTNVNSNITANFKEVRYDDYVLKDIKGKVKVDKGIAVFDGIAGSVLDGYVKLDGLYDSSVPNEAPAFDMKYDLSQMKWSKTFAAVETFQKLAPIGKFIDGLFNSTLTFNGKLQDDMFPDFSTLSASGFIHTLEGAVNGLLPLKKVGNALGVKELENFDIKDTKNWFTIANGFVEVKPFDFDIEDMKFTAGGKHGIEQNMDYVINAVIPRDKLKQGQIGKTASQGLDFILNEAGKKGVNVDLGDFIYVDIYLTGNFKDPKIKVVPKGSGGKSMKDVVKSQVENVKETVKDSLKKVADKKIQKTKEEVISKADVVVDKAKTKVEEEKDKAIDKGKEIVKDKVGSVVDDAVGSVLSDTLASKVEDKVDDVLGGKADKEVDKIKDQLKKWDPFKKKKDNKGN